MNYDLNKISVQDVVSKITSKQDRTNFCREQGINIGFLSSSVKLD